MDPLLLVPGRSYAAGMNADVQSPKCNFYLVVVDEGKNPPRTTIFALKLCLYSHGFYWERSDSPGRN